LGRRVEDVGAGGAQPLDVCVHVVKLDVKDAAGDRGV
jgi:hypothetical protein